MHSNYCFEVVKAPLRATFQITKTICMPTFEYFNIEQFNHSLGNKNKTAPPVAGIRFMMKSAIVSEVDN